MHYKKIIFCERKSRDAIRTKGKECPDYALPETIAFPYPIYLIS